MINDKLSFYPKMRFFLNSKKYFKCCFLIVLLPFFFQEKSVAQKIQKTTSDSLDIEKQYFLRQTQKGTFLIGLNSGMSVGVRNSGVSFENSTLLLDGNFTPKVGYFIKDRLLIGGNFDFIASIAVFDSNSQYSLSFNTLGTTIRYYHKTGLFLETQFGLGKGKEEFIRNNEVVQEVFNGNHFSAGIGLANFWDKTVNFELLLKYNSSWGDFNRNGMEQFYMNSIILTAGIHIALKREK